MATDAVTLILVPGLSAAAVSSQEVPERRVQVFGESFGRFPSNDGYYLLDDESLPPAQVCRRFSSDPMQYQATQGFLRDSGNDWRLVEASGPSSGGGRPEGRTGGLQLQDDIL